MKNFKIISLALFAVIGITSLISGCTLAGLSLQKDYNRVTNVDTLDAHLNITAWQYIKNRSYFGANPKDTIFRRMYDAIIYSGIDTNEYKSSNRTFILLNNAAVTTSKTGLWATVFTAANKAGTKWSDYSATDVKNYLHFLMLPAQYSHYNLPTTDVSVTTLAPAGTYTANPPAFKFQTATFNSNPTSVMLMKVVNSSPSNTSDYPIQLNDVLNVLTSDLLATNGVVQVINLPLVPSLPQ